MELMGRYAAANHACIHQHVAENLGGRVLLDLENHHNFAWKERHVIGGVEREVIVHRKGATPAGAGVLGIIPVPWRRRICRERKGKSRFAQFGLARRRPRHEPQSRQREIQLERREQFLRERGVTLISAGLDEVPMAYKNIREVMAAQKDLVTTLGQFDPKLVKMPPAESVRKTDSE